MKYSEFLKAIASQLTEENYFICLILNESKLAKQYPRYTKKLRKTVAEKLTRLRTKHPTTGRTLWNLSIDYKLPQKETRIKWLETLAKIHESKGN